MKLIQELNRKKISENQAELVATFDTESSDPETDAQGYERALTDEFKKAGFKCEVDCDDSENTADWDRDPRARDDDDDSDYDERDDYNPTQGQYTLNVTIDFAAGVEITAEQILDIIEKADGDKYGFGNGADNLEVQ